MQTIAALSLMENESASKRLQAVSYAKTVAQPNNEILKVLIAKMNNDKHTNVRLAAAIALAKFAENTNVRHALIKTLETEENANMQIELIQILVDIEEKRVIPVMKKLLRNNETPSYIKDQINSELKQII
jgi:HEAT repeat protein